MRFGVSSRGSTWVSAGPVGWLVIGVFYVAFMVVYAVCWVVAWLLGALVTGVSRGVVLLVRTLRHGGRGA